MAIDNDHAQDNDDQSEFAILRVYLKDASFETPNTPQIFTEEWHPKIELELSSSAKPLEHDIHEVVISVTVTATQGGKTGFLAEVNQAGIFTIKGFDEEHLGNILGAHCPNVLYPFAREAISDLVVKGGFPQVLLAPINFDSIYAQRIAETSNQLSSAEQS